MAVCADALHALNLAKLPVPPGMTILRMDVEEYTDWTGDPSLRIDVLIDEDTEIEKIKSLSISEFEQAIHDRLIESGIPLFPYLWFAKPSDLVGGEED